MILYDLRKDDQEDVVNEEPQRHMFYLNSFSRTPCGKIWKTPLSETNVKRYQLLNLGWLWSKMTLPMLFVQTQLEDDVLAMLETQPYPPHDKVGCVCFQIQYM